MHATRDTELLPFQAWHPQPASADLMERVRSAKSKLQPLVQPLLLKLEVGTGAMFSERDLMMLTAYMVFEYNTLGEKKLTERGMNRNEYMESCSGTFRSLPCKVLCCSCCWSYHAAECCLESRILATVCCRPHIDYVPLESYITEQVTNSVKRSVDMYLIHKSKILQVEQQQTRVVWTRPADDVLISSMSTQGLQMVSEYLCSAETSSTFYLYSTADMKLEKILRVQGQTDKVVSTEFLSEPTHHHRPSVLDMLLGSQHQVDHFKLLRSKLPDVPFTTKGVVYTSSPHKPTDYDIEEIDTYHRMVRRYKFDTSNTRTLVSQVDLLTKLIKDFKEDWKTAAGVMGTFERYFREGSDFFCDVLSADEQSIKRMQAVPNTGLLSMQFEGQVQSNLVKFKFERHPTYTFISHKWYGEWPDNISGQFLAHLKHLTDSVSDEFLWIDFVCFPQLLKPGPEGQYEMDAVLANVPRIISHSSKVELFRLNPAYQRSVWCTIESYLLPDDGFINVAMLGIQKSSDFHKVFLPLVHECITLCSYEELVDRLIDMGDPLALNAQGRKVREDLRLQILGLSNQNSRWGHIYKDWCRKPIWHAKGPFRWVFTPMLVRLSLFYVDKVLEL